MLSAKQAAEMVGLTKAAVMKAAREGRVSGNRAVDGSWEFDPVEIQRYWKPATTQTPKLAETVPMGIVERLEIEIKLLRELLASKEDEVAYLRKTLDEERAERMQRLLTDSQHVPWWRKMFR